jgi:hypothetical protein
MRTTRFAAAPVLAAALLVARALGPGALGAQTATYPLASSEGLELINVRAETVELDGRTGLRVTRGQGYEGGETLVLIEGTDFENGTIEIELAGEPAPDADPSMRGFVGVAFRADTAAGGYECFYLRPTNARAEEQLRRNHTAQYVSHPEYPWYRLREESPGVYESYVDLEPGAWTPVRIEVDGTNARLYVNDSPQPVLVVSDLKRGKTSGLIGLWLHSSTVAHFRDLRITAGG